jgi:hypothetical protein
VAFASYHSELAIRHNTVVNFPHVNGQHSGAFKTDDYYLFGVDRGTVRNPGNRYIDTTPGWRAPPPHMDGQPLANRHWTLAGAIWDPFGHVGPAGRYWVYDVPFLTTGGTCQAVAPATHGGASCNGMSCNGMSCDGEYYGVQQFRTNFDTSDYVFSAAIHVERQNALGGTIGTWAVADGNTSTMFRNMRHFAARAGGRYVLTFPGNAVPTWVELTVNNINNVQNPNGNFIMAVSFDGNLTATGHLTSWPSGSLPQGGGYVRHFTHAIDWATFEADTTGTLIWQDHNNNRVWVRPQGGLTYFGDYETPLSDRDIYRPSRLVLYAN